MGKSAAHKPAKNSKLPDPKIWKWCKHPECMKKARQLEGFGGQNEQVLMRKHPDLCVIFPEDYCWCHLSPKRRVSFKKKLETHLRKNHSLEEANLLQVKLKGAELIRANLKNANLIEAQLQGAKLWYADLREADLVNAILKGADFVYAKLKDSRLEGVLWEGARYLTWKQIEIVGEEKIHDWESVQDAYLRLKNYFHQQGQYEDEGEAYYREKLMAQCEAWENRKLGRWLWLFTLNVLAGYGERVGRTVIGAIAVIFGFGLLYFLGSIGGWCVLNQIRPDLLGKFLDSIYFSVLAFSTFGFGTIAPACGLAKLFIVIEIILGYVFLGTLVTLIARKMGR